MPGFFGKSASRLLREAWGSASELAEELYAMFGEDKPQESSQPIIVTQQDGQPAIRIIDNTNGQIPPIVINRNGVDENADTSPCCTRRNAELLDRLADDYANRDRNNTDGSGGNKKDEQDEDKRVDQLGLGTLTGSPPPPGATARCFAGQVQIEIRMSGPDPIGWDRERPVFGGKECRYFMPPAIPQPRSALGFAKIQQDMLAYIANISPQDSYAGYRVISDTVGPPGNACANIGGLCAG